MAGGFTSGRYRFEVERRGSRVFHRETRTEAGEVRTLEAEVHYVVGSGAHGKSYLVNREGLLFQSPVSWFSHKQIWDTSPGFAGEARSGRPVVGMCLFCHANQVRPVEGSINRYEKPLFNGYTIGCERCHGPGSLHVDRRGRNEGPHEGIDLTIVNPAHLPRDLAEAVCQQCHLRGPAKIPARGRKPRAA